MVCCSKRFTWVAYIFVDKNSIYAIEVDLGLKNKAKINRIKKKDVTKKIKLQKKKVGYGLKL